MRQRFDWPWVEAQAEQTARLWNACRSAIPASTRYFTKEQQFEREQAYDQALDSVEHELQQRSVTQAERAAMREHVLAAFGRFSARALDLESGAIDLLTREFLPVGTRLAQWARRFDPSLAMADIIQACRNAWTACGLQPLLGQRVAITPGILGYSLLYPYSDNYLDDETISAESKLEFSACFRRRLRGDNIAPRNDQEQSIWRLIELIETQFDRGQFPQVYDSLLGIHRAQEQSVKQLRKDVPFDEVETLRLSCEKGGSSVLADACLAAGRLNEEQSRFAFNWGVLLQLGDDLQDVRDDLRRGSMTLFSHAAADGQPLDRLTLQLFGFADHVASQMDRLSHGSETLKSLLKMSWKSLIVRAIADSREFFSRALVEEAECYSPFRFQFLRDRQDRIAAQHGLYGMMFEAFLENDDAQEQLPVPDRREDRAFEPHINSAAALAALE